MFDTDRMGKAVLSNLPAKPPRRRDGGGRFFWLFLLAIIVTIGAVVLMANDFRNLRAVLGHYDIEWPPVLAQAPPEPQPSKGRRLRGAPIRLPSQLIDSDLEPYRSAFLRDLNITGPDLCDAFQQAGIANDGWNPGQFDKTEHECFSEITLPTDDAGEKKASFFFMAKGTSQGALGSIRIKLVAPETAEGETVLALYQKALNLLMRHNDWGDLEPAFDRALALDDFAAHHFGLSFKFSREFNAARRFNLVIATTDRNPADARTRDFFAEATWLPVPAEFRQWRATRRINVRRTSLATVAARATLQYPAQ